MQRVRKTRGSALALAAAIVLSLTARPLAGTEENAEDFMDLHKVEIAFHEAGTTKNLDLMLSLFADDAVLIAHVKTPTGENQIKTNTGKEQVKKYWQAAGPFQPANEWAGYTPAFRIRYEVDGERAHLYFECLWVDKKAGKIAAHTNSDDTLARVNGRWLIKEMKAASCRSSSGACGPQPLPIGARLTGGSVMNSIDMPRRQFLRQSGALVTSAAVLNSPLLTQAFAAQPGEEIIPWSDQPPVDPGSPEALSRTCSAGKISIGWRPIPSSSTSPTIIVRTSTSRTGRWRSPASSENRAGFV
jgi:hypothetical protein